MRWVWTRTSYRIAKTTHRQSESRAECTLSAAAVQKLACGGRATHRRPLILRGSLDPARDRLYRPHPASFCLACENQSAPIALWLRHPNGTHRRGCRKAGYSTLCRAQCTESETRAPWRRTGPWTPSSTTTICPDQLQLSPRPPEPSRSRHPGIQRHERWLHQSRAVPGDVLQNPDTALHVAVSADVTGADGDAAGEPSPLGRHLPARFRALAAGLGADAAVVHVCRVLLALLCARIARGSARSTQLGGERTAA